MDREDCIPEPSQAGDVYKVTFRGRFLAAVFEAPAPSWSGVDVSCPGYPLSPDLLDQATSDKESKIGQTIKLEALTLVMKDEQGMFVSRKFN